MFSMFYFQNPTTKSPKTEKSNPWDSKSRGPSNQIKELKRIFEIFYQSQRNFRNRFFIVSTNINHRLWLYEALLEPVNNTFRKMWTAEFGKLFELLQLFECVEELFELCEKSNYFS